ncbi:uncharacterized protein MKZ38_008665 [Zalerion maritima]|uniref:SnoaL-like domain-containing protein n=1 Tax=Zalerion maritima TaxID=339359 RepID=A0AAD5RHF4_9PEZI|nr:uncharacterized protein MKZ38_008665 [Zalerion maritima]
MDGWKTEKDFKPVEALHGDLDGPATKRRVAIRRSRRQNFFEMQDYSIFDLMGTLRRPNLGPHYDHITPYLGHTNQTFKDVEIVVVTPTFGYITATQRVDGTAADGASHDFTFRSTSLVRKMEDGSWKYVHEHYSFPVDMATKVADFTRSQKLSESLEFKK